MNKPDAMSITVQFTHSCGQVFEQRIALNMEQDFSFSLTAEPLPLLMDKHGFAFNELQPKSPTCEVTGRVEKVDITGMVWETGKGLFCQKCGADMLWEDENHE